MNFDMDRLPHSELEEIAKRLLVRAAGTVPGPSDKQLSKIMNRFAAGHDGTSEDIDAIATKLDQTYEPGMGGMFRFDAGRTVGWLPNAVGFPEIVPGIRRVLLRNFAHSVYFGLTETGVLPLAVLPDQRTKVWWHDMAAREGCAPETA